MKVHLHTILAGPKGNHQPGIVDLPDAQAQALLKAGYATAILAPAPAVPPKAPVVGTVGTTEKPKAPETASHTPATETAAKAPASETNKPTPPTK